MSNLLFLLLVVALIPYAIVSGFICTPAAHLLTTTSTTPKMTRATQQLQRPFSALHMTLTTPDKHGTGEVEKEPRGSHSFQPVNLPEWDRGDEVNTDVSVPAAIGAVAFVALIVMLPQSREALLPTVVATGDALTYASFNPFVIQELGHAVQHLPGVAGHALHDSHLLGF